MLDIRKRNSGQMIYWSIRLFTFINLLLIGHLCFAQEFDGGSKVDSSQYVERSKTIAKFYSLLNQENEPTVNEAFLIFHPEMEWSVAYNEYGDNKQKALNHINSDHDEVESLTFKNLRSLKNQLQIGNHEPNQAPHFSILPVEDKPNAYKAVFPRNEKALEIMFTFPVHPDYKSKISNIYLDNGQSVLELIGAK